jgi:uncharacterized membrane protein YfcA
LTQSPTKNLYNKTSNQKTKMLIELLYIVVGFIVGAMNAIAGGGMLIGFPVLIATGLPPIVANATASVVSPFGQISSAYGYRAYLRKVPRRYALLLIPTVIGGAAGSLALRNTPPDQFARFIPVLVLFGVALFTFQPLLHFHLHSHLRGRSESLVPIVLVALAIVPLSVYGGYFGAGYGFMMLAFLGFTNLHDTHMMNAMKNVCAAVLSLTCLVFLSTSGLINWEAGIVMAIGSFIGGYVGSRAAQSFSPHILRAAIIAIGLCAVVYLFRLEY